MAVTRRVVVAGVVVPRVVIRGTLDRRVVMPLVSGVRRGLEPPTLVEGQ